MKVILVGTGCFSKIHGGGEVYVRNLAKGLLVNQHTVIYVSIVIEDIENSVQLRLNNNLLEEWQWKLPRKWLNSDINFSSNLIKQIAENIRIINPDIIHAHGWKRYICLSSVLAKKPCIITAHHGGIICPAGTLLKADDTICSVRAHDSNCLKCCVKQVPGWKLWYTFLRYVPLFIRLKMGKYARKFLFVPFLTPLSTVSYAINEKIREVFDIGKYVSKIIAPSPAIADALIRNDIPSDKICVIPHGVPKLAHAPLVDKSKIRQISFVFVGRINYIKGLHILLQACAKLPLNSYELHIVGSPLTKQEKRYYARLRRQYLLKNIIWHGYKSFDEVTKILRTCDVMIHPTICLEVYGLTIAESLSVGRPVIATRCGGPEIQIKDGINGFLIPPNDVQELFIAMQSFIKQPKLIESMSKNIENVNDITSHINDIVNMYEKCRREYANA